MTLRLNGLLADCDGCGHLVKGGASPTCDYVLHTGQQRGCPPGKDCLHYIDKQIWEEQNMKKNNGHKIRSATPPPPVMPPKSASPPQAASSAKNIVAQNNDVPKMDTTATTMPNGSAHVLEANMVTEKEGQAKMESKAATRIVDDFGNTVAGLTVDRLALLLHRCQMAGLGGNEVSINGKTLPDTDTIAALIRENGILVELMGGADRS